MFRPGDDVVVSFDGEECDGEVVEDRGGWVLTRIAVDPLLDFGDITWLDPRSLVMVRQSDVRLADAPYCNRCGYPHSGKCLRGDR